MNPSYISRQHLNFEIDKFGLKETVLKWLYLDSYSGGSVTYRIYLKPFWRANCMWKRNLKFLVYYYRIVYFLETYLRTTKIFSTFRPGIKYAISKIYDFVLIK